jgi:citrate lyase subunit beta / citryl-CoA lyase
MTFTMGPALLFCPADRPERFQKAAERSDAVIVDLEDAVAPADKKRARGAILAQLGSGGETAELDPSRTIVRVNPVGTADFEKDLHCLAHTPYRTVMLAKAETGEQLKALEGYHVIALCETAKGIVNAAEIAQAPNVVGLMWGAEDLIASMGGTSSRKDDGGYRAVAMHSRSTVTFPILPGWPSSLPTPWPAGSARRPASTRTRLPSSAKPMRRRPRPSPGPGTCLTLRPRLERACSNTKAKWWTVPS